MTFQLREIPMRRMMLALSLAALATTSVGLSANAHAKAWTICNQTPEDLWVAVAWRDRQNRTVSNGWWQISSCSGCTVVMDHTANTEYQNVWVHAKNRDGIERFGGDTKLCVRSGAFKIQNPVNAPCGGDAKIAHFGTQRIEWADRDFRTRLTGSVNGRRCWGDG